MVILVVRHIANYVIASLNENVVVVDVISICYASISELMLIFVKVLETSLIALCTVHNVHWKPRCGK